MQDTEIRQPKISIITIVFIFIQIIFVIFLAISIPNILKENTPLNKEDQPEITISNLTTSVSDLPDDCTSDIKHSLTKIVRLNSTNIDTNSSNATIRDESLNNVSLRRNGSKIVNFIADIPNLQQSYQVFYAYSTNENFSIPYTNNYRAILCLEDEKQIIYPDFKCHSSFSSETRREIVAEYLRYFEFDYFSASLNKDNATVAISPVSEFPTETAKTSYINQTKAAIKSLGVSPDLFTYKVLTQADMTYRLD